MDKVTSLSDVVNISRQFQRSIHLDADFGRAECLDGYICQGTAKSVLENTAKQILETNQRAFTWTGPYGGGKSSLALSLCSLVHPKQAIRKVAKSKLGVSDNDFVLNAFNAGKNGWLVVPIVGKRASIVQSLYHGLLKAKNCDIDGNENVDANNLLKLLTEEADSKSHSGLLIVIDELGKFLEAALQNNEDIYFYQQLAETANRTKGKFVIIGVLHQAFEQYATKLGRDVRDEWAKIQGRFVDIPLISGSDELVELTGKAINASFKHPDSERLSQKIADLIRLRRPAVDLDFWRSLDACWPLHPVTAALLGPASKRRFGQNERSAFGFLVSVEPKGFRDFLLTTVASQLSYYLPSTFWDYLKINLEPSILASPDGHRWAQAAEAVDRAEVKGGLIHQQLTKTIAIVELFKNGSGLSTDDETLMECLPNYSEGEISAALDDLKQWSIIAYRKHLGAWGVFAGSDFDIDGALSEALISIVDPDLDVLANLTNLYPVVAKRHYFNKGALRWMNVRLCHASDIQRHVSEYEPENGAYGSFILSIPSRDTPASKLDSCCKVGSKVKNDYPIVVGSPKNGELIRELGRELLGMEFVKKNRPEHEGDSVARREIEARLCTLRNSLEDELRDAFINANWYLNGKLLTNPGIAGLSPLASNLADELFADTPQIINELLNRDKPSSTSIKARKELLHAMLSKEGVADLGFDGYPAEAGLYHSILKSVGIHREIDDGIYAFSKPSESGKGLSFQKVWLAAEKLVLESKKPVELADLYQLWSKPPFGLKQGVMPILAFAFILANKDRVAVYKNGMFEPELTDYIVDESLQDPSRISIRYVQIDKQRKSILDGINFQLKQRLSITSANDPLEAARTLVKIVFNLPVWAQRTITLTNKSRQIRDVLLRASDPHKVLFVDLPLIFNTDESENYVNLLLDSLEELTSAYDKMLNDIISKMLLALDASLDDIEAIKMRAKVVSGISGDFRLDGFAARLSVFDRSRTFYEGLLGLAVNKPSRDWNDQDVDLALITLADWALKFRQIEVLASIRDRSPSRKAIAVVFGTGDEGETISKSFDISKKDQLIVDELAARLIKHSGEVTPEIFLAALAQAGAKAVQRKVES